MCSKSGTSCLLKWGELSSKSGSSCLGVSFMWGELSWGCLGESLFSLNFGTKTHATGHAGKTVSDLVSNTVT